MLFSAAKIQRIYEIRHFSCLISSISSKHEVKVVETDFEPAGFRRIFASEKITNQVLTNKKQTIMKKMILALVAMLMMTTAVMAQSENNNTADDGALKMERISSYLDLTSSQLEPVQSSLAQMGESLKALGQIQEQEKVQTAWVRIRDRHLKQMRNTLNDRQYDKYVELFTTTTQNTAERLLSQK